MAGFFLLNRVVIPNEVRKLKRKKQDGDTSDGADGIGVASQSFIRLVFHGGKKINQYY
jgi:hypothetical protein